MNQEEQLKVQAWLDSELAPQESARISDLINSDMEAKELAEELTAAQTALKIGENKLKIEDSREFYWNQISRQIEADCPVLEKDNHILASGGTGLTLRWLVPVGSLVAISALILHFDTFKTGQGTNNGTGSASEGQPGTTDSQGGLSENPGLGLMEEEVSASPELGVFSFEGTKSGGDYISPEDPKKLPESIENPEN